MFDVVPDAQTKAAHEKAVQRAAGREVKAVPGKLYTDIAEKRKLLREIYGGMMTLTDVARELGRDRSVARAWVRELGLGTQIGKRVYYETDEIAKAIVQGRGMCA